MATYDLERFSFLVVEDGFYLRSLLIQSLKALGIGNVRAADHGGEAIDLLRLMKHDPMRAGIMNIDVIMSNWQMSPVDGLMLLRWVRRHKDSPDRFIPFIMVTGHAEPSKVAEARDLGMTEMIGKPFSATSITERVLQIIDRPRQFLHTSEYFGPDRRRRHDERYKGSERRVMPEEDIEIVHVGRT